MMNSLRLLSGLLLVLASFLPAQNLTTFQQTMPPLMDLEEGNSMLNGVFTSTSANRWQFVYDSSYFRIQRPVIINGLLLRADASMPVMPFDHPSVEVVLARATADHTALNTTDMDLNMQPDSLVVRNPLPWVRPGAPGTNCEPSEFIELTFGQAFYYDPALGVDLVVDIRICGTTTPWSIPLDAVSGALGTTLANTTGCNAGAVNATPGSLPVIALRYITSPQWQLNSPPNALLNIENIPQDVFGPIKVDVTAFTGGFITVGSNLVGQGWEFILTPYPGLSAAEGALTTPGGQLVNINLAGGNTVLFNGLSFPPWISTFVLPYQFPGPIPALGAQMQIFDPSHPDNSRLSALAEFSVSAGMSSPAAPIAGPSTNNSSVSVPIGGFRFMNKIYDTIQVTDNGRIVFGSTPDDSPFAPSQHAYCDQPPFIGCWMDLDPSLGGSITISADAGSAFRTRIDYVNVPYASLPGTASSFSIILNGIDSSITLEGLSGIAAHPAGNPGPAESAWLGAHPGFGRTTDHGSSIFTVAGPIAPPSRTAATYEYGTAGTVANGLTDLIFTKSASTTNSGNLNWTGQ